MKFLKKLKDKFEKKMEQISGSEPIDVSKPISISDLLDSCIGLLKSQGKVIARYYEDNPKKSIITVYPVNSDSSIFWMNKDCFSEEYKIHFGTGKEFNSVALGNCEKFAELYKLCKGSADETLKVLKNQQLASFNKKIAICNKEVRQYM